MLFEYLAARWRYRKTGAKRFLREGFTLQRRAHYLAAFWNHHLSRSRAAQTRWSKDCAGRLVTILGAGTLLDVNVSSLSLSFQAFRLVDANPWCVEKWGCLNVPVEPVITDITRCHEKWLESIRNFRGLWPETLQIIERLGSSPEPAYAPATDALLSLNVLSQLEVGWQESVESLLKGRFGYRFVKQHEQDWLNAIRGGSQMLAEQHLAALAASAASDILLIADAEYVDYTGPRFSREIWQEPPVRWHESRWEADPGVGFEVTPALEGLTLDSDLLAKWLPSYAVKWHDTWLWHISPNGAENTGHGTVHRVVAFALHR